jgi:outer membrane protein assembly factor BamB
MPTLPLLACALSLCAADGALPVFTASNPDAWTVWTRGAHEVLELAPLRDTYEPPFRSPRRIALIGDSAYGDFRLSVEGQQTSREYGHRDLVVVFGFESPERFYYAHFASEPDTHACNLFVVDGAARRALAPVPARGVGWGAVEGPTSDASWHRLTVERIGGQLRAWFDGSLVVEANDTSIGAGLVGVGSFDDSGRFRSFELQGEAKGSVPSPFEPVVRRPQLVERAPWPQGAGPNGNWTANGPAPPLEWSAVTGEGVRWRTPLPATGQGGVAVGAGRLYLTTMAPWSETGPLGSEDSRRFAHATEGRQVVGKHIDAHCVDAGTGHVLWTRRLTGEVPAIHSYPFSDATTASPVTDGERVWFTNASGRVACFTKDGALEWERTFVPTYDGPFNKQFEPFLVQDGKRDVFVHMEPFPAPGADPAQYHGRWNHLVGLDAATGALLWRSVDGLTHYNTPTLVRTEEGMCALVARGGPHDVPERPVGVSLVRLDGRRAGQSVWRYDDHRGNHEGALHVMAHDGEYAYWVLREPRSSVVALDLRTGREAAAVSLRIGVTHTAYDATAGTWRTERDVTFDKGVFPARYTAHAADGRLFFQCYATAFGSPTLAPTHAFGRVDVRRGVVEYLEVPTDVAHEASGRTTWRFSTSRPARALDANGVEVTGDERSRWDGWDWVFNPAPTGFRDRLYFTLANGLVYSIVTRTESFDASALLGVHEVGPAGGVWSASSCSAAEGALYLRTGAELLCIGAPGVGR